MEYTDIYTDGLEWSLEQQQIKFVKRPAPDLKRSLGMVRAKTIKYVQDLSANRAGDAKGKCCLFLSVK
jgi:hypothetical protein